jgi:platelet-activating factor acetylhydrolase IB subunit alpha
MVLTEKQKKELNEAILDYMLSEGDAFKQAAAVFQVEANIQSIPTARSNLLEKKWLSIVRLQKKIMELEGQIASGGSSASDRSLASTGEQRIVPKGPAQATLSGHRSSVNCLAVHPQFSLLASGSDDNTIKLWDFDSKLYERTLTGHTGAVTGLAFDTLGRYLCSCSVDTSAKIWDMKTFACTATLRGHDHSLSAIVVVPPAGDFVMTCSRDSMIKTWEVSTGYCTKTYAGHSEWVRSIDVTNNGEFLASGGVDQLINVWRANSTTPIQVANYFCSSYQFYSHNWHFFRRCVVTNTLSNASSSALKRG